MMQYNTKICNLFGGPSSGKSTIALLLAGNLKEMRRETEYVDEVAKGFVWEERYKTLEFQEYLFVKQARDISRVYGKVEFIVVDSPPIMGLAYLKGDPLPGWWEFVHAHHHMHNNLNIFLNRVVDYSTVGRNQDEAGADEKAKKIRENLDQGGIEYICMDGLSKVALPEIFDLLGVDFVR